jgi:glucose-6-phosphate isomerase
VSTNLEATKAFGIDDSRVFGFWDWVGGRYSVWSSIGLPVAIAIGGEAFRDFLSGAEVMDNHFRDAPLEKNLPVMLALLGIWRRNLLGMSSVALIPYDQRLARFAAFIQQLDMESNGKQTRREGQGIQQATGPVIWGEAGTNAQHSFFQLLHQGSDVIPVDFLIAAEPAHCDDPEHALNKHHDLLLANALAQASALAFGRTEEEARQDMQQSGLSQDDIDRLAPHKTFAGNRPSTMISYRSLDPFTLGRLIALYEHKVFVQGVIWDINSFDQWGVELGKVLATSIAPAVSSASHQGSFDSSTTGLLNHIHALRKKD